MKALVVDDDVVSRMALMDLLASYGMFEPVEADDGATAWALLESGLRPQICFCDVRMPHLSGIELLQRMKANPVLARVPFVLVSSASDRETVLQAVGLGAVGYILKPLNAAEAHAHLGKIFRVTIDKQVEHPGATLKRLNIGPDRLGAYLSAFIAQLDAAQGQVGVLLAAGAEADARRRIDAVYTGCMTLGLWQGAAQLDAARADLADARMLGVALDTVGEAAARQIRRIQAGALSTGALD